MPHIIVKLWPGKSEAQKRALSDAIVTATCSALGYGEDAVSVGFEEVAAKAWNDAVYEPDIRDRWNTLTKVPGYGPGPRAD